MPALIEAALDCGVVFCVVLCIAFLLAVRYTVVPLLNILNVEIAGVHLWGGLLTRARNAVIVGCEAGIADLVHLLGDLEHAIAWSFRWQLSSVLRFVHSVEHSLDLLWRHAIKGIAASLVAVVQHAETLLAARVTALTNTVKADVTSLKATIASTAKATLATAEKYTTTAVTKAEATLRKEIVADVHTLTTAIGDLQKLLTTDITNLTGTIGAQARAAEAYADAAAAAAARAVEGEIAADVAAIDNLITSTVNSLEAEIAAIPIPSIADLAATVAGLSLVLTTVLAESGLDNPSCRTKVKGICGTDLSAFLGLLAGLAAVEGALNIGVLITAGTGIIGLVGDELESFVRAA